MRWPFSSRPKARSFPGGPGVLTVRPARRDDIPGIVELWREFIDWHTACEPFFVRARDGHLRFEKVLRRKLDDRSACILVAGQDGRPVGYLMASIATTLPHFERREYGSISDIAVTAGCRRQGVGRRLFEAAEEWFAARGVTRIELGTAAANPASNAFWQALGFRAFLHRLARGE